MTLPRILTIMGSGETSPTMVSTHRMLVGKLPKPVRAVLLDTPYGFQENAPELATKAVEYFNTSINVALDVAGLTEISAGDAPVTQNPLHDQARYYFELELRSKCRRT